MAADLPQDVASGTAGAAPPAPPASPLQPLFEADDEIELANWGNIPLVSTFGEPQTEYAALRTAAGLLDQPHRGFLELTGKDRHAFLNNLLTNGLVHPQSKQPLPAGHGCYAFFLNLKGRIVADVHVLEVPDQDRMLVECDLRAAEMLHKTWDLYLFAEKVTLTDRSTELFELALHGPGALELFNEAADAPVTFPPTPPEFPATRDLPVAVTRIGGVEMVAWRRDMCGVPGLNLVMARDQALAVWNDLTTRFGQTGDDREYGRRRLRPVGWAMFNACRIEAGTPLLGIDFAPSPPSRPGRKAQQEAEAAPEPKGGTLPAETGSLFDQAVSVTSGCYLGQEVVARMHARAVTARKLVGIRMEEDALPSAGSPVELDDQDVGIVTSSTLSPILSNACLCLATLKRPHFELGTQVTIPAEGRRAKGQVVDLPFLKPADAEQA